MNKLLFTLLLFTGVAAQAQAQVKPVYDKALADSFGADEHGMKNYVFVILKTGTQAIGKEKLDSIFSGHMHNIERLAKIGKLTVAGPLGKNDKNYRGIFIFNVKTKEEARELLKTDPALNSGLLDAELYEWYGAAALPAYLPVYERTTLKKW